MNNMSDVGQANTVVASKAENRVLDIVSLYPI